MKQRGITLIETMVFAVFAACIVIVAIPVITGASIGGGNMSYGINGMTESRCIEGFKFVLDQKGNTRQILDEFGKGVRCGNPDPGKMGSFTVE